MPVRKRCLIAAFLLMLVSAVAQAQEPNVVLFDNLTDETAQNPAVQSAQVHKGDLYALAEGVLYRCFADTGETEALIDLTLQDISDPYLRVALTSDGESLYLLDAQARVLYLSLIHI